jgi:DNA-directed RNA polymerase subunit beta
MNKIFLNNIGDLGEAQRASFYRFLYKGISEELENFTNPFLSKIKFPTRLIKKKFYCLVYLDVFQVKFKGPYFTIEDCLKNDLTYSTYIYLPAQYSYDYNSKLDKKIKKRKDKKKNSIKKIIINQDIFFGEIPLMTEEGSFIINGCEKIIISQIIRSPGVYFQKEFSLSNKAIYTATIISNKGLWTKVILDEIPKFGIERIYIKLNEYRKKSTHIEENDEENILSFYELFRYYGLNYEEMYDSIKYPHLINNHIFFKEKRKKYKREKIKIFLKNENLFFNQQSGSFSIGELGRYKINHQLDINLPKNLTYLTIHDFIGIFNGLLELKYYDRLSDDIDHIKNKQIRSIGELLQNQFRIALFKLKRTNSILNNKTNRFNFENDNNISTEEILIDPRSITNTIKEFFMTSQLSQFMDQINPLAELTHKRRISVFGPNGLKRDHISTVIRDIHPSQYGRLCPVETPEGQNAGLISSFAMYGKLSRYGWIETPYFLLKNKTLFLTKSPIYLNPEQETKVPVAFSNNLINSIHKLNDDYLSVKEDYLFQLKKIEDVNFFTTSPLQLISLATSLIPFIEHDDANRALMGSNMQRQAVPLLYAQKPIIGTGLESISILDSQMVIKSYNEGIVEVSSSSKIIIKDKFSDQRISYYLTKYKRSNQETCINQKPIVWPGEEVFSGQIIADSASTNDSELSLGRNLTIAYMPWEGYNYEDAIVINERILLDDCLTSIHIEEYETTLNYSLTGNEKITKDLPYVTKYARRHLNSDGIVKIGSYVHEDDILVGKLIPVEEDLSAETKFFKALLKRNKPPLKDTSLKVASGTEGRIIDVRIISTEFSDKEEDIFFNFSERIKIYIAQIRKIKVGDKLAGRHGNKGIISRILSSQDMPYLPDGTPVDIVFNPLGVPSRMNVGQVFECLLGLAGQHLGNRFKVSPFDEIYGKEASRILVNQKLKEAAQYSNLEWLFNSYSPGKILLRDGRTGDFFDNPITVGKTYILKLIHLVEDKIHARATGPYTMITEQPLAGKSQKGGQRFGEMEVWALEAYGASYTLQELLTMKSDDIDGRNDIYETIILQKEWERIKNPNPSISEGFLVLIKELNALGLDFVLRKVQDSSKRKEVEDIERDIFNDIEKRLKLRALINREKPEKLTILNSLTDEEKQLFMSLVMIEYKYFIKEFQRLLNLNKNFRNDNDIKKI